MKRPPSRHKTPPRATGLELPITPHTPPKTQKDCDEYLHTINLKGIGFLLNDVVARPIDKSDSDYESFSSSSLICKFLVEEIKDFDGKTSTKNNRRSPEIIITRKGKQIITPRLDTHENKQAISRPGTVSLFEDNNEHSNNNINSYKHEKKTINPLISYKCDIKHRRKRFVAGKLRSNTVITQQKPQDVPFETGLDAEFLNLFAK